MAPLKFVKAANLFLSCRKFYLEADLKATLHIPSIGSSVLNKHSKNLRNKNLCDL